MLGNYQQWIWVQVKGSIKSLLDGSKESVEKVQSRRISTCNAKNCARTSRRRFFIKNVTLWQQTKVDAFEYVITALILDSDWLRVVHFKCNTSANYTSQFWIMIGWKKMRKNMKLWNKNFSRMRRNGFKRDLPELPPRQYFHIDIISK